MEIYIIANRGHCSALHVEGVFRDSIEAERCLAELETRGLTVDLGIYTEQIDSKRLTDSKIFVRAKYVANLDCFEYGGVYEFRQAFRNENGIDLLVEAVLH